MICGGIAGRSTAWGSAPCRLPQAACQTGRASRGFRHACQQGPHRPLKGRLRQAAPAISLVELVEVPLQRGGKIIRSMQHPDLKELLMPKSFPAGTRTLFVDLVCGGASLMDAAVLVGASARSGSHWWRESGGMTLDSSRTGGGLADRAVDDALVGSRYLTLPDRVTIQVGLRAGWSHARIAAEIGRDRTVIWREVGRNRGPDGVYYATRAHNHAHQVRRRPNGQFWPADRSWRVSWKTR